MHLDALWTQDLAPRRVGVDLHRRLSVLVACLLAATVCALGASPALAAQSSNVEAVTSIPELKLAIAINFIGDTMFASTAHGGLLL